MVPGGRTWRILYSGIIWILRRGGLAEILPGGNSPVIQQLVSGQADFIVGNADQYLLVEPKNLARRPVGSSAKQPSLYNGCEESGIETLADLKSMTLGLCAGRAFALYMQKHLPMEDIKIVGYPVIIHFRQ